jgi:hypothetical protein
MRTLLGAFAVGLLMLCLVACGEANKSSGSTTTASTSKNDRDDDGDHNDDDGSVLNFGQAADAAEMRTLVTLVTDYFAAASTEDGAKACSLLMPFVAESVVENLSHDRGMSGKTCAAVMSKLFAQHHSELAAKSATLKFYAVRVEPNKALAVLSFSSPALPPEVRVLIERRDSSGNWRILMLLDEILE